MREVFGADLEQSSPLVRSSEAVMQWDNGVRFEEMASGEQVMDPSYIRVPSGTGSEGFYSHNGEEFIYVISGRLFVELKDHGTFQVAPGDALYFPSTTPHRWWAGEEPVGPSTSTPRRRSAVVSRDLGLEALLSIPALFGPCVSPDGKWVAWSWSRLGPPPTCSPYPPTARSLPSASPRPGTRKSSLDLRRRRGSRIARQ